MNRTHLIPVNLQTYFEVNGDYANVDLINALLRTIIYRTDTPEVRKTIYMVSINEGAPTVVNAGDWTISAEDFENYTVEIPYYSALMHVKLEREFTDYKIAYNSYDEDDDYEDDDYYDDEY